MEVGRTTSIFSPAGAVSPREALILVTFFEEPDRLAAHAENLGQTPFSHPDTRALAALALDMVMRAQAEGHSLDGAALQAEITRKGLESAWRRLLAAVRPGDRFSADPSKKIELDMLLQQAMTLHRRALVLHTELRAAERAFSEDPSESNFALLAELKAQVRIGEGGGMGGFGGGDGFGASMADIFEDLFGDVMGRRTRTGGRERGSDLRYNMEITLDEAFAGKAATLKIPTSVTCEPCSGTGAKAGSSPKTCKTCGGQGRVRAQQGFFAIERTCPHCQARC